MNRADNAARVVRYLFVRAASQHFEGGHPHGVVPVAFISEPALGPTVEQIPGAQQRQQVGHQEWIRAGRFVVIEQPLDQIHRIVPVDRDIGCQRDILRIHHHQRVCADGPQAPHRGSKARDGPARRRVRPQHRANPQAVDRPALQRDQRDQPLAGGRHFDRPITAINGEAAQQVQRELF